MRLNSIPNINIQHALLRVRKCRAMSDPLQRRFSLRLHSKQRQLAAGSLINPKVWRKIERSGAVLLY